MGIASLVIGILTFLGMCISLVPFLNLLNCFTLPLALLGVIVGLIDLLSERRAGDTRAWALAGIALNLVVLLGAGIRFLISFFSTGGIL